MKKSLILSLLAASFSTIVTAQNLLPVKKVTVFKNGTAMLVREGNSPLRDGVVALPIPEQTLFGTFFIGTPKDNSIKNIVFRNDTLRKKTVSYELWHFLAGNTNKPVTISYSPTEGIDKTVSGKVVSYDLYSGLLRFTTDAGRNLIMNVNNIYAVDFREEPVAFYMADSVKRMLIAKPEKPVDNITLQEVYMTGGINWLPSYYLRLKDEKTARLEMKATIENYAEELKDAETELVVGAPQMIYSGKPDPMTYDYLTGTLFDNSAGLNYKSAQYLQSNTVGGTAAFAFRDENSAFTESFSTSGEKNGDMYIYKLGRVTLPEKSKGTFPIFASNIDYKDKYEGSIYDITNYYNTRYCSQEEKTFDIFHSLELKNTSGVPLTTASVMVVNEKEQFVAQDELKYTPVGSSSNVRLSKAIDIIMKNTEEEKTREDNAKKIGKTSYSKVVLKGIINVENYQEKEVTVSVSKQLSGTVLIQSDSGTTLKANSYNYINPSSTIKWEVALKPAQKKTLTYEYEVFFVP